MTKTEENSTSTAEQSTTSTGEEREKAAFICSRDSLDGGYPALILGINAARQGMETKIFHTFMGLNLLCKDGADKAKFYPPGFLGAIPGMPNMASMMMKGQIKEANIPTLADLQETAQLEGVELVACKMTIDMMKLDPANFLDNVTTWNAEAFIRYSKACKICLFT